MTNKGFVRGKKEPDSFGRERGEGVTTRPWGSTSMGGKRKSLLRGKKKELRLGGD